MIGKIYRALTPFYDSYRNKMAYKGRPVLIIAETGEGDYVVLPISRVTRRENLNETYDIKIAINQYPKLSLRDTSYVRTHKQTTVHRGNLDKTIGDMRKEYFDLYQEVLRKREQFSNEITKQALMEDASF